MNAACEEQLKGHITSREFVTRKERLLVLDQLLPIADIDAQDEANLTTSILMDDWDEVTVPHASIADSESLFGTLKTAALAVWQGNDTCTRLSSAKRSAAKVPDEQFLRELPALAERHDHRLVAEFAAEIQIMARDYLDLAITRKAGTTTARIQALQSVYVKKAAEHEVTSQKQADYRACRVNFLADVQDAFLDQSWT